MYKVMIASKTGYDTLPPLFYERREDAFRVIEDVLYGDFGTGIKCTIEIVNEDSNNVLD